MLRPSLRQKKRYILFEIIADGPTDGMAGEEFLPAEAEGAALNSLRQFLGELGMAKAGIIFLRELCANNHFVLKVNHASVDEVKAAIILTKTIKNRPVILHSVLTSGTLQKIRSREFLGQKKRANRPTK